MGVIDRVRQLQDMMRALIISGKLAAHDRWTRERLLRHQRQRLVRLLRFTVDHSDFYRELYQGIRLNDEIQLADLPIIDKRMVMENLDRLVTDRRLKRADLEAHLKTLTRDECYLGQYRVLATAGTSGFRGIFVFSRREWSMELANTLRWHRFMGVTPRLLRRVAICALGADRPMHVSARVSESSDIGLFRLQRLPVTMPLDGLVAALNSFQPEVLLSYPSVASLLALEQIGGRLDIRPRVVSTHSERLSDEMARRIAHAWGTTPFDHYGLTEISTFGVECIHHRGLHMLDDLFIAENLDEAFHPVEPGQMATRLVLTNLYNLTQPLIRYEVSDMLTMSKESCPCGRPFPLIASIGGRSEETVRLVGTDGRTVDIPPLALSSVVEEFDDIVEFRIRNDSHGMWIDIVLNPLLARQGIEATLIERMRSRLKSLGARPPFIDVVVRDRFERTSAGMGKHRMIEIDEHRVADSG